LAWLIVSAVWGIEYKVEDIRQEQKMQSSLIKMIFLDKGLDAAIENACKKIKEKEQEN